MSQPQHRMPSNPTPHQGNPAERLAQADVVIGRETRQRVWPVVERRKIKTAMSYRRRKGDC